MYEMYSLPKLEQDRLATLDRVIEKLQETKSLLEGTVVRVETSGENAGENSAAIMVFANTEGELAALKFTDILALSSREDFEIIKYSEEKDDVPFLRRWPPWVLQTYEPIFKKAKKHSRRKTIEPGDRFIFRDGKTITNPTVMVRFLENIRSKLEGEITKKEEEIIVIKEGMSTSKIIDNLSSSKDDSKNTNNEKPKKIVDDSKVSDNETLDPILQSSAV